MPNNCLSETATQLNFAHALLHAGHYDKASTLVLQYLQHHRANTAVCTLLANLARINGELSIAADYCAKVLAEDEGNATADLFLASLGLKSFGLNTLSRKENRPAPFLLQENFLSPGTVEEIWCLIKNYRNHFIAATVSSYEAVSLTDTAFRNNLKLNNHAAESLMKRILIPKIESKIPALFQMLQTPPKKFTHIEMTLNAYQNGHYFKLHKDNTSPLNNIFRRKISFVYFLLQDPKPYQGGELLLYDAKDNPDEVGALYTKIIPRANTLIAFPSDRLHEVTEVMEATGDFMNSRFVINGHIQAEE